jgi:hypothetical protein
MIASLFFCVLAGPIEPAASLSATAAIVQDDKEVAGKIAAAGRDVAKLLDLATSYTNAGKSEAAGKVYKRVLELDADNEAAHKGLHHQLYDKKWFESFTELTKYKRDEAARMKAKGLARYKDQWVPEADAPFMNMGWVKDEDGSWASPADAALAKQAKEWKAAGYKFRADDDSWVAPADFDKWAAIQWKCGDQWVDTAKANEFHSKFGQWWQVAGEHFTVWTTCEWDGGNAARWYADRIHPELVRIFGVEPSKNPHFIVLNGLEQYNQAAGGQPPLMPESEGISSLHGAYFADIYFDLAANPPQFLGTGVCYWDRKDPKNAGWGPYFLRWAAAQSWVEAIDPSWGAIGERIASGSGADAQAMGAAFWGEKKIPRWLRYGAASYAERFLKNPEAAEGSDPWTLRSFAFSQLKKAGGLHKLDVVFAFALDLNDADNSGRLYDEAGLLVSYLLDGATGNQELQAKHAAFKTALKSGAKADVAQAAAALQTELAKNEDAIKKYAGL